MKIPQTAELQAYIAKHPHLKDWQIHDNLKKGRLFTAADVKAARAAMNPQSSDKPTEAQIGRPISELIDQFDDVKKLTEAMKELSKGSYLDDEEMRRRCKISPERWKAVTQREQVSRFRFQLPKGRHVWMHVESQAKLSAAINQDQN